MSAVLEEDVAPATGQGAGERVVADLITGVLLYGGIGYLIQRFFAVPYAFLIGILFGLALSVFLLIKRYGGA
ncbi:MAG: hypothetical protein LBJ43_04605 [Propionibacteriaceae bacterium]|jgi:F0F1-type ATP synthase assembly protein I|nr:hypothetical protein [Propionibacteriaceae bacterium]